jgi:hypothetical protein
MPGLIKHQECKAANQDPANEENNARASTHWRANISITIVTTYRGGHGAAAGVVQQPYRDEQEEIFHIDILPPHNQLDFRFLSKQEK